MLDLPRPASSLPHGEDARVEAHAGLDQPVAHRALPHAGQQLGEPAAGTEGVGHVAREPGRHGGGIDVAEGVRGRPPASQHDPGPYRDVPAQSVRG